MKSAPRDDTGERNAPRRDQRKPDRPAQQGALGAALAEAMKKR